MSSPQIATDGAGNRRRIKTYSPEVDDLLGGGFNAGELVEIFGPPGIGKTSFCARICVLAQIQGSVPPESQALYVTDNSTSTVETLRTIATHAAKLEKRTPEIVENALDNIGVVSIQDAAPLLSLPLFLDRNYLPSHPQTKLIILDNYNSSLHVRDANGNNTLMSKIGRFLQQMSRTASSYEIPVLAVNSVREDGIPPGQKSLRHVSSSSRSLDGFGRGLLTQIPARAFLTQRDSAFHSDLRGLLQPYFRPTHRVFFR